MNDKAFVSSSWHLSQTISFTSLKEIPTPTYFDIDERGVLRAVYLTDNQKAAARARMHPSVLEKIK